MYIVQWRFYVRLNIVSGVSEVYIHVVCVWSDDVCGLCSCRASRRLVLIIVQSSTVSFYRTRRDLCSLAAPWNDGELWLELSPRSGPDISACSSTTWPWTIDLDLNLWPFDFPFDLDRQVDLWLRVLDPVRRLRSWPVPWSPDNLWPYDRDLDLNLWPSDLDLNVDLWLIDNDPAHSSQVKDSRYRHVPWRPSLWISPWTRDAMTLTFTHVRDPDLVVVVSIGPVFSACSLTTFTTTSLASVSISSCPFYFVRSVFYALSDRWRHCTSVTAMWRNFQSRPYLASRRNGEF